MKKKRFVTIPLKGCKKLFLMARIVLFFLFVSLVQVSASVYSQQTSLALKLKDAKVEEVFRAIEEQSNFYFLYRSDFLKDLPNVSMDIRDAKVEQVLDQVISPYGFTYEIDDRIVVIKKNTEGNYGGDVAQQNKELSGTIVGSDGQPIPGVSVIVEGTTVGTVTDSEGKFVLNAPANAETLQCSFVGMLTKIIPIGENTVFNVVMEDSSIGLDEVVAIGYGTMKKSDLTGSVGVVSAEELNSIPVTSVSQGLQGRLAGVAVTSNSSAPGGGISVKIRGNTSILNGSEPLYVIDGFPITGESQFNTSQGTGLVESGSSMGESGATVAQNPLASLNPADIASIEVLKDASACAIYGVRGANGVVLITTKRGKVGKPQVSFSSYVGVQSANKIDMMNAEEYMDIWNAGAANSGQPALFTGSAPFDTDWQDEIFRQAIMTNYQLSVSGGSEAVQYNISGSYFNQDGVIKGSGFDRYSLRSNLDIQVGQKLKIGNSLTVSRSINNAANVEGEATNGVTSQALQMSPLLDVYMADGVTYSANRDMDAWQVPDAQGDNNPVASINERSDEAVTTRILGSLFGEYSITNDLKFRVSVGADIEERKRHVFTTDRIGRSTNFNRATVSMVHRSSYLNENTLNYNKKIGQHTLGALAGFTIQKETEEYQQIIGSGFASNATTSHDLGNGSLVPQINSNYADFAIASFLGRVNYNYDDRYLITATLRRDGSSKFAKGKQWATFPSASVAWRINNESFMADADVINNLKLRVGYGVVGNQELAPYGSLALLQGTTYVFNGNLVNAFGPFRVAVPNLTWETTNQVNVGLDLSLLDSRINVTGDYYVKKTKDLLLEVQLPESSGITEPSIQNIGEMENKGWEFAVDGRIISTNDFSWTLGVNISANKNEITSLGNEDEVGDLSFETSRLTFAGQVINSYVKVGQPIGVFYGYKYDGLVSSQEEADALQSMQPGIQPGFAKYVDVSEDGSLTSADRTEIGSPHPDFIYGISTNIKYKKFELRMFLQGQQGGKVFNMMRSFNTNLGRGQNMLAEMTDYWTTTNTDAKYPKPYSINAPNVGGAGARGESDFYLEDASYLRMREVTLSYYLPDNLFGAFNGSVYLTGQNLFTITDYTGYNPDTNGRVGTQGAFGYDVSSYPLAKAFILGVKLNF